MCPPDSALPRTMYPPPGWPDNPAGWALKMAKITAFINALICNWFGHYQLRLAACYLAAGPGKQSRQSGSDWRSHWLRMEWSCVCPGHSVEQPLGFGISIGSWSVFEHGSISPTWLIGWHTDSAKLGCHMARDTRHKVCSRVYLSGVATGGGAATTTYVRILKGGDKLPFHFIDTRRTEPSKRPEQPVRQEAEGSRAEQQPGQMDPTPRFYSVCVCVQHGYDGDLQEGMLGFKNHSTHQGGSLVFIFFT